MVGFCCLWHRAIRHHYGDMGERQESHTQETGRSEEAGQWGVCLCRCLSATQGHISRSGLLPRAMTWPGTLMKVESLRLYTVGPAPQQLKHSGKWVLYLTSPGQQIRIDLVHRVIGELALRVWNGTAGCAPLICHRIVWVRERCFPPWPYTYDGPLHGRGPTCSSQLPV